MGFSASNSNRRQRARVAARGRSGGEPHDAEEAQREALGRLTIFLRAAARPGKTLTLPGLGRRRRRARAGGRTHGGHGRQETEALLAGSRPWPPNDPRPSSDRHLSVTGSIRCRTAAAPRACSGSTHTSIPRSSAVIPGAGRSGVARPRHRIRHLESLNEVIRRSPGLVCAVTSPSGRRSMPRCWPPSSSTVLSWRSFDQLCGASRNAPRRDQQCAGMASLAFVA
jgi:hypothetical protein